MSELSDQIHDTIQKMHVEHQTDETHDIQVDKTAIVETPAFAEMKGFYDAWGIHVIKKVNRQMAGTEAFETPLSAYERTEEAITKESTWLLINVLADGIQMGQGTSLVLKKYKMFNKVDKMFFAPKWRQESEIIALTYADDADTMDMVGHMVKGTCLHLGQAAGFDAGHHNVRKIWDCWAMSIASLVMSLYYCGYAIGQHYAEETVLAGIVAATEEGTS